MADFSSLKQTIQSYIKQNGNEEITGNILQDVLLAMVSTMGDSAINSLASGLQDEIIARQNQDGTLQGNIAAETTARQQADTALGGRIDGLQTVFNGLQISVNAINTKLAEGYIYAGIATPSTNPGNPSGKVFYIALQAGTYTDFGGTVVTEGITILKYNGSAWSSEQVIAIDDVPTAGSDNPVKSSGVYNEFLNVNNALFGDNILNSITFTRGGINSSTGVPQPDVNFARANTDQYIDKKKHTIKCGSAYKILRIYKYSDTEGTFVSAENIQVTSYTYDGEYYTKYEFVKQDGTDFADAHPTGILTEAMYSDGVVNQLNELSSEILNINNALFGDNILNSITFTRGGINSSTGVPQPDVNFARANTDQYFDKKKYTIKCGSAYKILRIYKYSDTEGTFVSAENIQVTSYTYDGEYYAKYEFVKQDGTDFADAHPTGILTEATFDGVVNQLNGLSFWKGTQAEYDALGTYDDNTVYFIY